MEKTSGGRRERRSLPSYGSFPSFPRQVDADDLGGEQVEATADEFVRFDLPHPLHPRAAGGARPGGPFAVDRGKRRGLDGDRIAGDASHGVGDLRSVLGQLTAVHRHPGFCRKDHA